MSIIAQSSSPVHLGIVQIVLWCDLLAAMRLRCGSVQNSCHTLRNNSASFTASELGLFNRHSGPLDLQMDFRDLGFKGAVKAPDVWAATDLGSMQGSYKVQVPGHGVVLLRVSE
jgi:hypothetical protein